MRFNQNDPADPAQTGAACRLDDYFVRNTGFTKREMLIAMAMQAQIQHGGQCNPALVVKTVDALIVEINK